MPGAGGLNTQLKLQSKTVSQSTRSGEETFTWSNVETLWAGRLNTSGREFLNSDQPRQQTRRVWRMYHRAFGPEHRLVEAGSTGNVWDIVNVYDPDGRRQWVRVEAVRRDST